MSRWPAPLRTCCSARCSTSRRRRRPPTPASAAAAPRPPCAACGRAPRERLAGEVFRHPRAQRDVRLRRAPGGLRAAPRAPAQHRLRRRPRRPVGERAALGGREARSTARCSEKARLDPAQAARAARARAAPAVGARRLARRHRAALPGRDRDRRARPARHRRGAATPAPTGLPGVPRRLLHIGLPHTATPEQIRDAVQSWLQRQARRVFEERCALFAPRLGVRVRRARR